MEKLEFRLLDKEEIECRVQQVMKDNSGCILLLYKTARTDYNLLDEVVGAMNWKCDYKEIKGNLYCEISIYNKDLQQWISKSNCGVESNTEAEKGEASDSLKRAGFVWGIGRELYTAPFTYIKLNDSDFQNSKLKTQFKVKEIGYTNRAITKLIIEDNKGNIRFTYGNVEKGENKDFQIERKQINEPQEKTPKKAQKKAVDSDLPFTDTKDLVNKYVSAGKTDEMLEEEQKQVSNLEALKEKFYMQISILNKDLVKAKQYYESVFGKKFENWDLQTYQEVTNILENYVRKNKGADAK